MNELNILPTWLDAIAAALAGASPQKQTLEDALPGLAKAQTMNPLQRLQLIQQSQITESISGQPVDQTWRKFLRSNGASRLVIDATGFDSNAKNAAEVLNTATWLMCEGVLIAIGLRDSGAIELRLPEELKGKDAVFLNAVDSIRVVLQISVPQKELKIVRGCQPDYRIDGQTADSNQLIHTPETWCRIALAFRGEQIAGASLLTLRRGMKQRGLVELSQSKNLREQINNWGGGIEVEGIDPILVFDDGMGGFLPLSKADLSCSPLTLESAGIIPSPTTLMVMTEGVCMVRQARRAIYRYWKLAENEDPRMRGLLARGARLIGEITIGRGEPSLLEALEDLVLEYATQGLAAVWPLSSSLKYFREQWETHIRRDSCPENLCLDRKAAPCHATCPANIDIPSFMTHLGKGDYRATVEVIRKDNPFPLTCGLVCPAPCESACVKGGSNGAVHIRPLKAKAAEHCLDNGGYPKPEIAPDTGKKIGIIGAGPSSLSAAYYLRTFGHAVEVFEEQEHAGGMLRYGIPAYRMPPDLLAKEIEQISVLGVNIKTNTKIDSVEEFRKNYDAVFIGLGTQRTRVIPIEGVHLPFVLGGIDFLRAVRSGEKVHVGPRVVVVGGGNVAIDVALTARRQGGQVVELVSLEKRREMPASQDEIELAVTEGVTLHPGWGPLRVEEEGVAVFQYCERVKDEKGLFNPLFDEGRLLKLEVDHVILAVGQGTNIECLEGSAIENMRGFVVADPKTKMTTVAGVFAGGDGQHGPRTAVEAIRSGKIAATSIDAWLQEMPMNPETGTAVRRAEVTPQEVSAHDRSFLSRVKVPQRTVEETVGEGNYVQIEEGLTDEMAKQETHRCLRCDVCIGCGLCMAVCSEMGVEALRMAETSAGRLAYFDFNRPADLCIGCGACSQICPTGAIRIEDKDGIRRTIITGTVVKEQELLTCSSCGAVKQVTPAHRDYIRSRLPEHMSAHLDRELCTSCERERADRPGIDILTRSH